MNVVTHLLVGRTLAEHTTKSPRDRALITAASVVLMAYAFALAVRRGYSPVGLFSARGDAAFVETLRRRWRSLQS